MVLAASAASAEDALHRIEGVWGWRFAADMTCDANPHEITFDPATNRLSFRWQHDVRYSDGSQQSGDDFDVLAVAGDRIDLIRRRDGQRGVLVLSPDGKHYAYGTPLDGSEPSFEFPYDRCLLPGA